MFDCVLASGARGRVQAGDQIVNVNLAVTGYAVNLAIVADHLTLWAVFAPEMPVLVTNGNPRLGALACATRRTIQLYPICQLVSAFVIRFLLPQANRAESWRCDALLSGLL